MIRPELNKLLNATLPFAKEMLEKNGEFYPFGATIDPNGKISLTAGKHSDSSNPNPQEVADFLLQGFRRKAKDYRAIALCRDVRVHLPNYSREVDAAEVFLEHSDGEALRIFLPYHKKKHAVTYDGLISSNADGVVFNSRPTDT